jgi:hypothetical protein
MQNVPRFIVDFIAVKRNAREEIYVREVYNHNAIMIISSQWPSFRLRLRLARTWNKKAWRKGIGK